ncbi:type II toxin-antitoxin system VapC family toxin [Bifidobacterium leontopitheci]|uniref:PIN domain-containing protein n=1 Tax=Bifidobacterium leontopitheci TaxID=2650774 RepID=A0A6I1GDM0_9BIFI|nr:type II toxin-antitoxin system VapC family toxin [Bifidobacterium leontopitheci]KAB7789750.1 PIN domain-containing protein [Bifidobacterium leontopitheci]
MFDLLSSEDVFAEVVYHYRRNNPQRSGDNVKGVVDQMRELVTVVSHYDCERAQSDYLGSDPNDLHLHAAAKDNRCDILLTNDCELYGSLAPEQLDELPYSVCTADDFFCDVAESSATLLDQAVTCELRYWSTKCPDGDYNFAKQLSEAGCPRFAYLVRRALMRKSGLSPCDVAHQLPLGEEYSQSMRENDIEALASISDDF